MYARLYARVFYPAYLRLVKDGSTLSHLDDLIESQFCNLERLETLQLERLKVLLAHAASNSPFYRKAWEERALRVDRFLTLEQLRQFPVVSKAELRDNLAQIVVDGRYRLTHSSTGGSTGEPFRFAFDAESARRRAANSHRAYGWAGADLGVKRLYLWGQALSGKSLFRRVADGLRARAQRRRVVSCFIFAPEDMANFLAVWRSYRPEVVVGYVNPLYEFARYLEEGGVSPPPPRSIVVGAERLFDFQRALMERVFQAPVFETYGSREFLVIAAECPKHEGLHLSAENLIVEILDDDGKPTPEGSEGNVVITDLTNFGMPFIRYMNGDRAVAGWGKCSCGRGLPLLRGLRGRQLDVITALDGRRIPGEFFPHFMKDWVQVKRFQVVQKDPGTIVIQIIGAPPLTEAERKTMETQIRNGTGWSQAIEIQQVSDIPRTKAGKLNVVVRLF